MALSCGAVLALNLFSTCFLSRAAAAALMAQTSRSFINGRVVSHPMERQRRMFPFEVKTRMQQKKNLLRIYFAGDAVGRLVKSRRYESHALHFVS